jgi:hypothetical protein
MNGFRYGIHPCESDVQRGKRSILADRFFLGVILVNSGLATAFYRGPIPTLILFFMATVYLFHRRMPLSRNYIFACLYWLAYVTISSFWYFGDHYYWPLTYIFNFTIALAILAHYRLRIFGDFCACMYVLAAISLGLFAIQIVMFDYMWSVWETLDMSSKLFDKPYTSYAHFLVYTVHQFIDVTKGSPRNSGFCWEPGAFACFLLIAIYFQLAHDQFDLRRSRKRYLVFALALFSTGSTTGLVGFIVLLAWYFLSSRVAVQGRWSVALVAVVAAVVFLPDQIDKISNQSAIDVLESVYAADQNADERGIGRFQSFYVLWNDIYENPLLGVGANKAQNWAAREGLEVNPTTGLGNMFATYGVFLMAPYLWILFKSSSKFVSVFNVPGKLIFMILVLICGFSFSVLETPVFLTFSLFSLFFKVDRGIAERYLQSVRGR